MKRDECRCKGCGLPNEYCYKLKEDYAMLQSGMCGTNAELSNAWATAERAEAENERLKEYGDEGWAWVEEFCKLSGKNVFDLRDALKEKS